MSVKGIGTDIVNINRIDDMTEKVKDKLAKRVLTPYELELFQEKKHSSSYLAKRWAAKEAASKALGFGIANGLSFQHFEVRNDEFGKPHLSLSGRALELANSLQVDTVSLSLSDEKDVAIAFVVLSS